MSRSLPAARGLLDGAAMRRKALCALLFAGCTEFVPPDPPAFLAGAVSDFAISYTHTAVVTAGRVEFDGGDVPGTGPLENIAATGVAIGRRHACLRTEAGAV